MKCQLFISTFICVHYLAAGIVAVPSSDPIDEEVVTFDSSGSHENENHHHSTNAPLRTRANAGTPKPKRISSLPPSPPSLTSTSATEIPPETSSLSTTTTTENTDSNEHHTEHDTERESDHETDRETERETEHGTEHHNTGSKPVGEKMSLEDCIALGSDDCDGLESIATTTLSSATFTTYSYSDYANTDPAPAATIWYEEYPVLIGIPFVFISIGAFAIMFILFLVFLIQDSFFSNVVDSSKEAIISMKQGKLPKKQLTKQQLKMIELRMKAAKMNNSNVLQQTFSLNNTANNNNDDAGHKNAVTLNMSSMGPGQSIGATAGQFEEISLQDEPRRN